MVELKTDSTSIGPLGVIASTWLLSASFILTTDSFSRTLVKNNIKEAKWLLYAVNLAVLVNEIIMLPQIIASSNCSNARESPGCRASAVSFTRCSDYTSVRLFYSLDVIKYVSYTISKTGILHLAYQRCKSIYEPVGRLAFKRFHRIVLVIRALEITSLVIITTLDAIECQGSYCSPACSFIPTSSTMREMMVPFFRIYYIILEFIFYRELLHIVKHTKNEQNYRDIIHQIILFSIDILQLSAMCIYRLLGFKYSLPTHLYAEIFSTSYTIFVMTRFWNRIKGIFDSEFDEKAGSF
ncbi:13342_t:CDS:1 [Acaulospora morrowiae]|uniref:13342_t:CDS:1 n=1 Tax=Acaulospora morrowiae TaxID=94023 RepID=A0A9N8VMP1_9GLOM|nr:13342_t:CDS:1 [Acaulospora morrowiae]